MPLKIHEIMVTDLSSGNHCCTLHFTIQSTFTFMYLYILTFTCTTFSISVLVLHPPPSGLGVMTEVSLVGECECRVSSVLGRNTRTLGKQYLFDGSPETCWNSDQGTPQWVALRWPQPVIVTTIVAQFQVCSLMCDD